ncbi:alpha/beta hydrolase-fold protein [Dietzia sp.]|uniref:alpha/beta hydrolase-fold protein n=1 Tax=Dietzia sp. TaxID=1871616 RepID=UPI002FD99B7D
MTWNRKQLRLVPVVAIAVAAPLAVGVATGQPGNGAPQAEAQGASTSSSATSAPPSTAPAATAGQTAAADAQPSSQTQRPAANSDVPSGVRLERVDWLSDRKVALWVQSPAMKRTIQVQLLLPRSWNSDPERTYPALYMLDGLRAENTENGWTKETQLENFFDSKDAVVVLPVGGESSFYTDWQNPAKDGEPYQWETFMTSELPPLVAKDWRLNDRAGVVGLSMGGTAAMDLAARKQGMYQFAGSFSGYLDTTSYGMPEAIKAAQTDAGGYRSEDMWGPLGGETWREHDPKLLVDRLKGTSLYVSAGSGSTGPWDKPSPITGIPDNFAGYGLELLARMTSQNFVDAAKKEGVEVTSRFRPSGTHSWPYWQFEMTQAWPQAAAALGVDAEAPKCETVGDIKALRDGNAALGDCLTGEYDVQGGRAQDFRDGRVFWSPETGANAVVGAIGAAYQADGGPSGELGLPTSSEQRTKDGVGRFTTFQHGAIFWSPKTGAHAVTEKIADLWKDKGSEGGELGYPVTDAVRNPNKDGVAQGFQNGTVFQSADGDPEFLKGAILAKYKDAGYENSDLGYPVSSEIPLSGGALTKFENGSIYWSEATGAHIVPTGQIFDAWGQDGYENGRFGYPKSDVRSVPGGGQEIEFEHGTIRLINGKIEKS